MYYVQSSDKYIGYFKVDTIHYTFNNVEWNLVKTLTRITYDTELQITSIRTLTMAVAISSIGGHQRFEAVKLVLPGG